VAPRPHGVRARPRARRDPRDEGLPHPPLHRPPDRDDPRTVARALAAALTARAA
jgi:hypothetical protein